jgi:oligogalacturonide lyase
VSSGITRRAMLVGVPGCLLASVSPSKKAKPLPRVGEFVRFLDPLTETPVVRLTNPTTSSFLPAPTNRFVSVKNRFLIFSSDRAGTLAPFQLDLRSGVLTQLAKPRNLVPQSVCLNAKANGIYLLDGDLLQEIALSNRKQRVIAEGVSAFCELQAATSTSEPDFVLVRQQRLETLRGGGRALADYVENFCLTRPGGQGSLFLKQPDQGDRQLWYAPFSSGAQPVLLASGQVTNPVWTRDGDRLLFLREIAQSNSTVSEIHSVNPENQSEQSVARTSQFAAFSPNADNSVFVGASRSKAQPTLLLLLASVQRELTLCEHRASRPASVSPVFSPDSKRVYFQSDHDGKSALYSVNVEQLIESTPDGETANFS